MIQSAVFKSVSLISCSRVNLNSCWRDCRSLTGLPQPTRYDGQLPVGRERFVTELGLQLLDLLQLLDNMSLSTYPLHYSCMFLSEYCHRSSENRFAIHFCVHVGWYNSNPTICRAAAVSFGNTLLPIVQKM